MPLFLSFEYGDTIFRQPLLSAVWMALVAALMVSRIPTLSVKRFRVPHRFAVPIMLAVALVAAFMTTAPWPTLTAVGLAYLASIPFTVRSYNRLRRTAEAMHAQPEDTAGSVISLSEPPQEGRRRG